jgi:hypothetical protein
MQKYAFLDVIFLKYVLIFEMKVLYDRKREIMGYRKLGYKG